MNLTLSVFRLAVVCTALFHVLPAAAQIHWDTLSALPAGPGCIHTRLIAPGVPWTMNVLEVDLHNSFISIETAKANDRLSAYERTSSMASRKSFPGHVVVGAVNGDFYGGTGIPINYQVLQGELLHTPQSNMSTLAFDVNDEPMLRIVSFSGTVRAGASATAIHGVNLSRGTNQLILYNKYFGPSTGTNIFGSEALVRPLGSWSVNDTVPGVVESVVNGVGGMVIPSGKGVLSGHGTSQTWINASLHIGDTVRLYQRLAPALPRLKELTGGFPKIVFNGIDYVDRGYAEEGGPSHTYERHPRTAAGFSADSSKLYLFTVDGRQIISLGMTLHELAGFMIRWGVHHGVNFDGGGSTTMVVRGTVVNSPSDGIERTVSNALLIVSGAPVDTLSRVVLNPRTIRIFRGDSVRFALSGADRYGNPITLNVSQIRYAASPRIGTIDSAGRFVAAQRGDSGFVYGSYGVLKDSSFVVVKTISRVVLVPQNAVTDTLRPVAFRTRAFDPDGVERTVLAGRYRWSTSNSSVGIVDSVGMFRGRRQGSTQVMADFEGVRDTADMTIQIGAGMVVLDSMESLQRWTFTGVNVDSTATTLTLHSGIATVGQHSLRVNYRFIYNPSALNLIRLNTDIPVFGVPDSILLDVRTDSAGHRVFYYVDDDDAEVFKIFSHRYVSAFEGFDDLRASMENLAPVTPNGFFNYPVRLRRIEVQLGSSRIPGAAYSGTIFFDNLRVRYPAGVTAVDGGGLLPRGLRLDQNFPNPFNPQTRIRYSVEKRAEVRLRVFDVLGREVAMLVRGVQNPGSYEVEWQAAGVASGVYFCRLELTGTTLVRKLLLVR